MARSRIGAQGIGTGEARVEEELALLDDRLEFIQQDLPEVATDFQGVMREHFCRAALEGMCKITAADVIGPALLDGAETGWHKRRQSPHAYLLVILFRKSECGQIEPQERGI